MSACQVVESLLFAAEKPLTARAIAAILRETALAAPTPEAAALAELGEDEVRAAIRELDERYQASSSGLMVQEVAEGFHLRTASSSAPWVAQMLGDTRGAKLSPPALETLAIIAYRQPMTRTEIEAVRGVAVDGVLATLLDRKLVKISGRSEQPGRPLLYATTPEFLEEFGLKSLDELPNADELRRLELPKSKKEKEAEAAAPAGGEPVPALEGSEAEEAVPAGTGEPAVEGEEAGEASAEPEVGASLMGNTMADPIPDEPRA